VSEDRRVLVADDNEDIRRDVARVLERGGLRSALAARAARLLPGAGFERIRGGAGEGPAFAVLAASSGEEALALARRARAEGKPIALAFVDVRMPPGIDGARVGRLLREEDPDIEVVLITAYADRTISELNAGERDSDRLLFLKKPYAREELYQLALSLTEKRIQRRGLRVAREQLEVILGATSDGLIGLDADHRVVFANRAARELLGRGDAAVSESPWGELATLAPRRIPGSGVEGAAPAAIEVRVGARWLELGELARVEHAASVRGVLAIRDVTTRKEIECVKDEFIQNTSHELRTPLVSIRGYLELALEDRLGDLAPPLRKGLEVARRASGRLLDLIDALLELARLETLGSRRVPAERVDVAELVRRALELVRPAASAKGLALDVALDPGCAFVAGDPRTLEVALRNLLGNAVKFTDAGTVGLRTGRAANGRVRFEVWDTGPGLPAAVEPRKLFERFRQGDGSISRAKGGVGIGLSLVERILRLHGDAARATNRPGGGASFVFELDGEPESRAVRAAGGADHAEPAPPAPFGVLGGALPSSPQGTGVVVVVDRSRATREYLRFAFVAAGHRVVTGATVAEVARRSLPCSAALVEGEAAALEARERFAPERLVVLVRPGETVAPSFETLAKPVTLEAAFRAVAPPQPAAGRELAA
jgi:signal transduction histidine kinase